MKKRTLIFICLFIIISIISILINLKNINISFLSNKKELKIAVIDTNQIQNLKDDVIPEFKKKYPNTTISVKSVINPNERSNSTLNVLDKKIHSFLNTNDVDILCGFQGEYLSTLISSNDLYCLDESIIKNNFPINNISEGTLYPIKMASNKSGKNGIYALCPTFSNYALIYNKDIFDKACVPYPINNMNWDQIFELCNNLKKNLPPNYSEISFGTSTAHDFYYEFVEMTRPVQKSLFLNNNFDIKNDDNISLWGKFTSAYKSYSMNVYNSDDFVMGNVAMKVISNSELTNSLCTKDFFERLNTINCGMISAPVFSQNQEIGLAQPSFLLSIPSKSKNKELAWKFIQFANGKEYALHELKNNASSFGGGLVSYYDNDIKNIYFNLCKIDSNPFYVNKGALFKEKPSNVDQLAYFDSAAREYMYNILKGKFDVITALNQLQLSVLKK